MHHNARTTGVRELEKIVAALPKDAPTREETLWAEKLGARLYRLDNTPWYAVGCALDDIVECAQSPGRLPTFVKVVRASGNLTARVFVPESPERVATKQELCRFLLAAGCLFEEYGSAKGLLSVTIPASVDSQGVLLKLNELESARRAFWESGNF